MPEPLSRLTVLGYGVGHLLNDLCSALWFTYSLLFFDQVIGFSSQNSGIILLIGQVADAIATPAIGIWSDRSSLCGLGFVGKRKSWYAFGTLLVLISMPFIYSPCISCQDQSTYVKLGYYAVFVVTFQFGWAAVQTVHLALVTDLTYVSNERTTLLALRNTFTVVANIAVYVVAFVVIIRSPTTDHKFNRSDVGLFQIITATVLLVGGIASMIFAFTVKEQTHEPLIEEDGINRSQVAPPQSLGSWFKKWLLYHVGAIYMCTRIYCNVIQAVIPLYLNKSLHLDRYTVALIPLVLSVAGFVCSVLSGTMNRVFGKKITFVIGACSGLGACIWISLDSSVLFKKYLVYIASVLFGAGSSIMLVDVLSITSDLIGSDSGNSAFVYGLMSFVDKLSCGIVIMLIQTFAPTFTSSYYTDVLVYTCGLSCICTGLLVTLLPSSLLRQQVYDDRPQTISPTQTSEPQNA